MKYILSIALVISIITYSFWNYLPKGSFYIGNSIFIFLLCLVIYLQNKQYFISFLLLCLSINNLLDELFFDPTKKGLNELIFALLIPIIYYARKICTK